jgi:hypothetical protein
LIKKKKKLKRNGFRVFGEKKKNLMGLGQKEDKRHERGRKGDPFFQLLVLLCCQTRDWTDFL